MYDYPALKTEEDENLKGIRIYIGHMCIVTAPGAYLVEARLWMLYIPETYVLLSIEINFLAQSDGVRQIRKVEV